MLFGRILQLANVELIEESKSNYYITKEIK